MSVAPGRWQLLRELVVLQVKLFADSARDVIMSPVTAVAGVWAILIGTPRASAFFYELIAFGRRTERWIDLFDMRSAPPPEPQEPRLDEIIDRVEKQIVEQYRSGGVTAAAKQAIDQVLDTVQGRARRDSQPRD